MPTDQGQCTCWLAPSTNGETNPSTWLSMQQEVEMHSKGGQTMRGWPWGVLLCIGETLPDWLIEADDGNVCALPLGDISAIDPIPPKLSDAEMINRIVGAISNPVELPDDGLHFDFLVGRHELIEVSLQLRRRPCQPLG